KAVLFHIDQPGALAKLDPGKGDDIAGIETGLPQRCRRGGQGQNKAAQRNAGGPCEYRRRRNVHLALCGPGGLSVAAPAARSAGPLRSPERYGFAINTPFLWFSARGAAAPHLDALAWSHYRTAS